MYKNQLQELAQRSCFTLPSYTCIREGPDHAPRFKAVVNFNGESFESPHHFSTLRLAEHAAAEVALNSLSHSGPSYSLAARILDETGVYKNLLQAISQRVGSPLPQYATFRSGLGHHPVFTGTVELAGITFTGEPAKTKKQAEKNAALAAWSSLKQLAKQDANSSSEPENTEEQEQMRIARALQTYCLKEKIEISNNSSIPFQKKFPTPSSPHCPPSSTSKILPLFSQKSVHRHRSSPAMVVGDNYGPSSHPLPQKYPYVPPRQYRAPCHSIAPAVTIRTSVPVFSAPPRAPPVRVAPPVSIRQAVPVFAAPPSPQETAVVSSSKTEEEAAKKSEVVEVDESIALKCLERLQI
ncbi:unnamed protein product [Cuscuta epithymum]|uniref:DRBM domain-containing protein n=1 Tax=Cuscuta epithymum TaxID=186058 RepID=A0AAV0ENR4_9ASTE|nr:unnamed protein product [Cuscuta epithymum]